MNRCPKCGGLVEPTSCHDPLFTIYGQQEAFHCVNCGKYFWPDDPIDKSPLKKRPTLPKVIPITSC